VDVWNREGRILKGNMEQKIIIINKNHSINVSIPKGEENDRIY